MAANLLLWCASRDCTFLTLPSCLREKSASMFGISSGRSATIGNSFDADARMASPAADTEMHPAKAADSEAGGSAAKKPNGDAAAGPHLTFTDCKYTVIVTKDGKPTSAMSRTLCASSTKPKELLNGITAEVKAGSVLAILGPSGAGKTTLLNMLTLEKKGGAPVGHLLLNGQACTFETCMCRHAAAATVPACALAVEPAGC